MSETRAGGWEVEEVQVESLGRVERLRDPATGARCYRKRLCPPSSLEPRDQERLVRFFENEGRLLRHATDPRVAIPTESGTDEAGQFYLFPAPENEGFLRLPAEAAAFSPERWTAIAVELCAALALLRDLGIPLVQLDPRCVFVRPDGAMRFAHLDWSHFPSRLDLTSFAANPRYAATELIDGQPTPASLVFSTGAWLYERIAGPARPAGPAHAEPLWRLNPAIPGGLSAAVEKAVQPEPERRYRNVEQLGAALRPFAASTMIAAPATAAPDDRTLEWHSLEPTQALRPAAALPGPTVHENQSEYDGTFWAGLAFSITFGLLCGLGLAEIIRPHLAPPPPPPAITQPASAAMPRTGVPLPPPHPGER
jgi:serine/threonine protein kinase